MIIELIGLLAGIITTFAWVPQILKILRTRSTADISTTTSLSLAGGVFLWFVYGVSIGSWPVMLANSFTFLFIAVILGLKYRFG